MTSPEKANTGPLEVVFTLPRSASVRSSLMDAQGRRVVRLAEGVFPPGRNVVDASVRSARRTLSAGIYFVRLEVEGHTYARPLVLMR